MIDLSNARPAVLGGPHMLPQSTAHHGKMKRSLYRNKILWCPGAGSNHRHCDFQSHALPTELPGQVPARGRERRFIVRPGSPVHHASPSASRGAATHGPTAKRARHSPHGDDGPPSQGDANCSKNLRKSLNRRLRRHLCLERRRNSTASGSDLHPGSARNKTEAKPPGPACRRSGKAFACQIPGRFPYPGRHRLAA
jgi:hypothetical protein